MIKPTMTIRLNIQPGARRVGITKPHHLWLAFGGSKSTAGSLWDGNTRVLQFETIEKLMTILKINNPGELFLIEEKGSSGERKVQPRKPVKRSTKSVS